MKRAAFFVVALAACGSSNAPLTRAAQAEAEGKLAEAKALYTEACQKDAATCAITNGRVARIAVKLALEAMDQEKFGDAKKLLGEANGSIDDAAKAAASSVAEMPDLVQGLAFEEASAESDKRAALPKMEAIAATSAKIAAKARAWLATNRPALLVESMRAACTPTGQGSCAELAAAAAALPDSPAKAEAKSIADAESARLKDLLVDAEHLMIQAVELSDYENKLSECTELETGRPATETEDAAREACESRFQRPGGSDAVLDAAFKAKLGAIHDPFYTKRLEERFKTARTLGIFDPIYTAASAPPAKAKR